MTDTQFLQYEDMLQAGMHFGRKRTVFNPRMGQYVHMVRDGICILDLLKTQDALKIASDTINAVLQESGLVLFVAPTKQSQESVRALADAANMPYVVDRWIGGSLTNFKIINARVKLLVEMEEQKANGGWAKYTKKEQVGLDRKLKEMQRNFEGLKKLTRLPDLVFIASAKEGKLAMNEAHTMKIKLIAIANTDANPETIAQVIPANDRSKKSVDLIIDAIRTNVDATPKVASN